MAKAKSPASNDAHPRLYLVTPILREAKDFLPQLDAALDAGGDVACVLVRLAAPGDARAVVAPLLFSAQRFGTALIVDGEARLALAHHADGVHVAAAAAGDGEALSEAVERLKPDRIVGAGGLRTRDDAMSAGEQDVDYVMFGEPSADGWTPPIERLAERVEWWAEIFNVPCIAYAARLEDVGALAEAGADFIALGDAVWNDPRGPAAAMRDAQAKLIETIA